MSVTMSSIGMGVNLPQQLGSQQQILYPTHDHTHAYTINQNHNHNHHNHHNHHNQPSPPPSPPSQTSSASSSCSSAITSASQSCCPFANTRNKEALVRRYAEHFCAFETCCYKFSDEGPLCGKSLDHLPVCHVHCWKLEKDRLERVAELEGRWREETGGLALCHRGCYMRALLGEAEGKEVVPRNRNLRERFRVPKWEHWIERILEIVEGS